jgi:hypothetical protein
MISRLEQVTDLRESVTDLVKTLETGGIAQLEPHERLDLWQYLQAVRVRLALVEQALGGEPGQSGSSPSATDISLRMRARRARARRRSWAGGVDESGGRRASR